MNSISQTALRCLSGDDCLLRLLYRLSPAVFVSIDVMEVLYTALEEFLPCPLELFVFWIY